MVEIDSIDYKEDKEYIAYEPDVGVQGGEFIHLTEGNISGTYDDKEEYVDEDVIKEEIIWHIQDTFGNVVEIDLQVYDYVLENIFYAKFTATIKIENN